MKAKIFIFIYLILVIGFIAVNELIYRFSDIIKWLIVVGFLAAAFIGRYLLKKASKNNQ